MQQQPANELQAELELALLQIHQLQEELEFYYGKYNKLKENNHTVTLLDSSVGSSAINLLRKARLNDTKYSQSSEFNYTKQQQNKIEHLQKELKASNLNFEANSTAFESEILELESQVSSHDATNLSLEANITELTKQLDKQAHWHQENKNRAEALQKQIEIEKIKSNALASEKQILQKEQAASVKDLNEKLDQRIRHADLNQKMLAKAYIDLEQLRNKYKEKAASEMTLVNLIKDLRDKLSLASEYYYRIQTQYPELALDAPAKTGQD